MPTYDYGCNSCGKRSSHLLSYESYGKQAVQCPHCSSEDLHRLISKIRFVRSEESRLDSFSDPGQWDDDDPKAMAGMMRKMGQELGEELPAEFDEVVDRLEAGESPENIEQSMPDLAGSDMDL